MPRIVLADLRKTFRSGDGNHVAAVADVSLEVQNLEWLTIVGPSGSGKTTLLRLIAGLETPDHGQIKFDDDVVTHTSPQERDVAMVFQSHALLPHLTAFENIAFGLKLRSVPRAEITTRVMEIAELLRVCHCLDRPPAKLSGGERQRIALGRALIRRPKILLLDEPFAHLDEPLRTQMLTELPALRECFATTLICVTHNQAEALALGDRVAVIRQGVLQQIAPPREIYERPANRFVAGFIGTPAMNFWHAAVAQREGHLVLVGATDTDLESEHNALLPLGTWRAEWFGANIGRNILLGLRPTDVHLLTDLAPDSPRAVVIRTQFFGAQLFVTVRWAKRELIGCAPTSATFQTGQEVALRFDLSRAHVFDAATGIALF